MEYGIPISSVREMSPDEFGYHLAYIKVVNDQERSGSKR